MSVNFRDYVNYSGVIAGLLRNSLRFRVYKFTDKPLKPAALSLAVTNRCNSHCIMCNIWKSARDNPGIKDKELSREKITSILSNRLFSELVELDLTGGEPHLREDLVDIVPGIARLKESNLHRLRSIIITSNGFLSKKIISNYRIILDTIQKTGIDLVSVISLDGIGETHDLIRGTGGAYKLASETISGLSKLKQEYPNLILGIKTTILPHNIGCLDSILDFAISNGLFHIISPVIFTGARFRNTDKEEVLTLRATNMEKIRDFYSHREIRTSYFYKKYIDYLATGKRQWICTALYNYIFIDYDGKVYPCEISAEPMGDVNGQNIADIWNSHSAHNWRKRIGKPECCRACHEPGAIRYSAIAEGTSYIKFLTSLGSHDYIKSLRGEGYSKYMNDTVN